MSGQIDRKKVDWEQASCRGLDTEFFYSMRNELMDDYSLTYNDLRRMCFSCPIWEDCLKVASAYEAYGFWGGVSEDERRYIALNKQAKTLDWLRRDLKFMPIKYEKIASIVKSVERNFSYMIKGGR